MRLAVLGSPVAHSLSPVIHTAAMRACGIEGTYQAIDCDAAGFAVLLDAMRSGELDGCNVTMPHKRLAHALADTRSARADRAGAVNTVVANGRSLVGHNTDVDGVTQASHWAGLPQHGPVLVLGAGGAAAAALLAFEHRELFVSARRPEAAAALARDVGVAADVVPFGDGVAGATVVNATPVGMSGEELPAAVLAGAVGLLDMPYATGSTPAAATMRAAGKPVATGEDMLVAQALESFRLWTGREAPVDAIRAALRNVRPA